MLVLDENVPADQRRLLRKWRVHFRVVGVDVASWGAADENLISLLHQLFRPTFFTLDRDFHRPDISPIVRGFAYGSTYTAIPTQTSCRKCSAFQFVSRKQPWDSARPTCSGRGVP